MGVGIVLMPQVLRDKLGDDGAQALVDLLNKAKYVQKEDLDLLAERLENKIREECAKVRSFVLTVVGLGVGFLSLLIVWK